MIMASLYESLVIPFSILLTLPLAIVGAVLALLVSGKFLDVYAVIGVILLMGLVTKNAILVVDYVEQLRAQGKSRREALADKLQQHWFDVDSDELRVRKTPIQLKHQVAITDAQFQNTRLIRGCCDLLAQLIHHERFQSSSLGPTFVQVASPIGGNSEVF